MDSARRKRGATAISSEPPRLSVTICSKISGVVLVMVDRLSLRACPDRDVLNDSEKIQPVENAVPVNPKVTRDEKRQERELAKQRSAQRGAYSRP